jgi:hypothetical protein
VGIYPVKKQLWKDLTILLHTVLSEIWQTGELKQSKMPLSFVVEPIHTVLAHNRDLIKSVTPSMTHFVKRLVS